MNILFPTNFTDISFNAFVYTLEFADKTDGRIVVFHAYDDDMIKDENIELYNSEEIKNLRENKDGFPMFDSIRNDLDLQKVPLAYSVRKGEFLESLESYIKNAPEEVDLIAMGTRSISSSILEFFIEKNSEKVLADIHKPVLVIPENAKFQGKLDKVLFMVNYKDEDVEAIEFFTRFNTLSKMEIHIVHFDSTHTEDITHGMDNFKEKIQQLGEHNFIFEVVDSLDFIPALKDYAQQHEIDMVCLLNKDQKTYFFKASKADMLVESVDIPVLAIYTT